MHLSSGGKMGESSRDQGQQKRGSCHQDCYLVLMSNKVLYGIGWSEGAHGSVPCVER